MASVIPIPTALKRLRGNPGHRPLNKNEPLPKAKAPTMPSWLDGEAKAEWRRIVPELRRLGLLTLIDRSALSAYCQAWAELRIATERLGKEGRVIERQLFSRDGEPLGVKLLQNPAFAQQNAAMDKIKKFLVEFGLTPASRSRMSVQPEVHGRTNPLDEIADGLRGSTAAG